MNHDPTITRVCSSSG